MTGIKTAFVAAILASAATANAAGPEATAFGARETVQYISLSPGGGSIAMVVNTGGHARALSIVELKQDAVPRQILSLAGTTERLNDCRWSTETRLICSIYASVTDTGDRFTFSRLYSLDSDGRNVKMMTARTSDRALAGAFDGGRVIDWTGQDAPGSVLITRMFVKEDTRDSNIARNTRGLAVERVDTTTLARKTIEQPRDAAAEYITDGQGTVRIMGLQPRTSEGYAARKYNYVYRKLDSRTWLPFSQLVYDGTVYHGFDPYAVDRTANIVYGFDDKTGRKALYRIVLDDTLRQDLVLGRDDVDVDSLLRIGRQARVVGVSYATDKRETEFFDPELRRLAAALGKALPGAPLVTFLDASADEGKLLLYAGGDNDPGRYYIYTKATRQLTEIVAARPQLAGMKLASVKPVTFPAADGTMIPGYLTLPPGGATKGLPAIVMPHGGPSARDEWGFDWLAQFYAARGYAVLQPNFRGSAGYGNAWFQKNGFQSWRTAIGDVNDAGRWLVAQGIAAPSKLAIVGWSYGGYAALQSAVVDQGLYKAVVAIAPITDLDQWREEKRQISTFDNVDLQIGHGPHVAEGSPARHADAIKVPVLLFHGTLDDNVGVAESRLMAKRLKDAGGRVDLVEFPGLRHGLDDDAARATLLDRSDAFLRTSLGM